MSYSVKDTTPLLADKVKSEECVPMTVVQGGNGGLQVQKYVEVR